LTIFAGQFGFDTPLPSWLMILGIIFTTLTFAPIINTVFAFGEELGWRGYLLPALLPLGKIKALIISSVIWGLWHVPFVILLGMHYGEQNLLGALMFLSIVTLVGIYIGYLRITVSVRWIAS
jgi:membrane protease YdiL (CAAX protease family)